MKHISFYKLEEKLLCIITESSYKVSDISKKDWSKYEGWDISYFDKNSDIV